VLPTTNGTDSGEEGEMSTTADISEPSSELERLIAELSGSGLQGVFDFGVDCHLAGVTTPVFRGPAGRRWWHAVLGDDAASSNPVSNADARARTDPNGLLAVGPKATESGRWRPAVASSWLGLAGG
jgi:hypothetical protein